MLQQWPMIDAILIHNGAFADDVSACSGMSVPMTAPPIMYGQVGNVERSVDAMRSLIVNHCRKPPQRKGHLHLEAPGSIHKANHVFLS